MILWGIISSVLNSLYEIFYKKSLNFKPSFKLNEFLYGLACFIGGGLVFLFVKTNLIELYFFFFVVLFINIFRYFISILNQKVYSQEKISRLMPYTKLNSVIGIIIAFFLFGDTSIFSLFIALIIIFIVVLFSIDFKELTFSKTIGLFIFIQTMKAFGNIGYGYVLLNISAGDYFVIDHLIYGLIGILSLFFVKIDKKEFIKLPKAYYKNKTIEMIFRLSETFIWAFLMSSLGLIITSILGFLGMGITLIMSYFVFGDKPTKKDLILTFLVTILVFLGVYFK